MRRASVLTLVLATTFASVAWTPGRTVEPSDRAPLRCPGLGSTVVFADARMYCATAATALGTQETAASALRRLRSRYPRLPALLCRVPPTDPVSVEIPRVSGRGAEGIGIGVEGTEADEDDCDIVAGAGAGGEHVTLYFPRFSTFLNQPGVDGFDPSLPVGILTSLPTVGGQLRAAPSSWRQPRLSTSGLTLISQATLQVSSNSDNSNTDGAAFAAASFKFYKLTAGESDPNYDYRIMYDTGSGHGGNLTHYLDDVVQRNRLTKPNMTFTAWEPLDTYTTTDPSRQITLTITTEAPGSSASVSHTFTFLKDKYGPRYFDRYTRFDYGWDGRIGCCDYTGFAGGSEFKYPQGGSYGKRWQLQICWNWASGGNHTCKWA